MKGHTILVTGATGGIGFFTARELAVRGGRVLITGRDADRGQRALYELRRAAGHCDLVFLAADHETVGGNRRLAQRVAERAHRLDVLVNNVGGLLADRQETADGYEATLALNAVGPFALTQALLPLLHAAGRSRVVNVVCGVHGSWRGDLFDDLQCAAGYVGIRALARAKLIALLWTQAFAFRPEGRQIAVNAADPGVAWTHGTRALTAEATRSWPLVWPLRRFLLSRASPERAALCSLRLAASPEVAGRSGEFFERAGRGPVAPCSAARDPRSRDRAWRTLSDLVEAAPTARAPSGRGTDAAAGAHQEFGWL